MASHSYSLRVSLVKIPVRLTFLSLAVLSDTGCDSSPRCWRTLSMRSSQMLRRMSCLRFVSLIRGEIFCMQIFCSHPLFHRSSPLASSLKPFLSSHLLTASLFLTYLFLSLCLLLLPLSGWRCPPPLCLLALRRAGPLIWLSSIFPQKLLQRRQM